MTGLLHDMRDAAELDYRNAITERDTAQAEAAALTLALDNMRTERDASQQEAASRAEKGPYIHGTPKLAPGATPSEPAGGRTGPSIDYWHTEPCGCTWGYTLDGSGQTMTMRAHKPCALHNGTDTSLTMPNQATVSLTQH